MLVSSSEGRCLDGLVAAILFRAAAMVAVWFWVVMRVGEGEHLVAMMGVFGETSDLCADARLERLCAGRV